MLGFTKNFHFLVESENILHNCNIILNLRKIVEPKYNKIFDKKSNIWYDYSNCTKEKLL